jgi:penicillin-binding protein 1B
MASLVDDAPMSMAQDDGSLWQPQNFSGGFDGEMPLVRALAESVNVATVRLGLQVGITRIADTLARLGGPVLERPFASLLLGAVEMAPVDVANVYTSLASDGLRPPLRAVREVVTVDASVVQRYPLTIDTVAGSDALFQLNTAMRQVMLRGTGRSASLPAGLATVGKSGTTNDFRDAWFAGYSADRLAVVWVGNDDNSPTGLTGSRGALPVWAALMRDVASDGMRFSPPQQSTLVSVDYYNGGASREGCDQAVPLGLPAGTTLPRSPDCSGNGIANKALKWLRDTF